MNAPTTPTLIVGTGRCGSTLVGRMIGTHPHIACAHELFTLLGGERAFEQAPRETLLSLTRTDPEVAGLLRLDLAPVEMTPPPQVIQRYGPDVPGALVALLPHLFTDPLCAYEQLARWLDTRNDDSLGHGVTSLLAWLADRAGKSCWVERSGSSGRYLDRLLQLWPNARIIHVYRNGVAVAQSMSLHPYFRILLARRLAREPTRPVSTCLDTAIPEDRFGAYFSAVTIGTCRALGRLPPTRVVHVGYENLLEAPHRELSKLNGRLDAWGVPSHRDWVDAAASLVDVHRPDHGEPTARTGETVAPGMRALRELLGTHEGSR